VSPAPAATARPGPAPSDRRPDPGHCASATLAPGPASAATARHITRDALTRWNLDALTDDAQLITSELTANAIAATPPGSPAPAIILSLRYTPPNLTIRLWDIGPGQPQPPDPAHDDENGRGLLLIDHLTGHNWGWWPCPRSGGKVVHATLTNPDQPHQDTP